MLASFFVHISMANVAAGAAANLEPIFAVPEWVRAGDFVAGRYTILEVISESVHTSTYRAHDGFLDIGPGGFGAAGACREALASRKLVVLKAERKRPGFSCAVAKEYTAMLQLAERSPTHIPRPSCLLEGDEALGARAVLVLPWLGNDAMRELRLQKRMPPEVLRDVGCKMLVSIQAVHDAGLLHRDIKPANFVLCGDTAEDPGVFLIDFGLARWYFDTATQNVLPVRKTGRFCGTLRYASMNSHLLRDLGRRDDLWSLAFTLLELSTGWLPWKPCPRGLSEQERQALHGQICREKQKFVALCLEMKYSRAEAGEFHAHSERRQFAALVGMRGPDCGVEYEERVREFLKVVPSPLIDIVCDLVKLQYASRPNYVKMYSHLMRMARSRPVSALPNVAPSASPRNGRRRQRDQSLSGVTTSVGKDPHSALPFPGSEKRCKVEVVAGREDTVLSSDTSV